MPELPPDVPTVVYSGSDIPKVWQLNASDYWLAPTLEDAIQAAMELADVSRDEVYQAGCGLEPVSEKALAEMTGFFNDRGEPQTGLDAYREQLAQGATVAPFFIAE